MPVIQIIVILAVIGFLVWAIEYLFGAYIAEPWKKLARGVAIVFTVLWLLGVLLDGVGLFNSNVVWPFRR